MIIRDSDGTKEFVDFREMAPAAAFRDMFDGNRNGSIFGGSARCVHLPTVQSQIMILTAIEAVFPEKSEACNISMRSMVSCLGRNWSCHQSKLLEMAGNWAMTLNVP